MPNLPGLRPTGDRPSVGGRNNPRVATQAPRFQTPGLRPVANPVDTFSRPQAAQTNNSWLGLARALGDISPALNDMLNGEATRQKQAQEDLANKRINGMSFEEARAAVDGGQMSELQNPWYNAAFMKQYGERLAYDRINQLSVEYETSPDKAAMNFDQFVAGTMAKDLEQHGDNKFFMAGYTPLMQTFNAQGGIKVAQQQATEMVAESQTGVYQTFLGLARVMASEGKSPAEIHEAIRAKYAGNREMLHVDFKTQDIELVRAAEAWAAEGNYALVQEVLTKPRMASDGTNLGALSENPAYAADTARILKASQAKQFEVDQTNLAGERTRFIAMADKGQLEPDAFLDMALAKPELFSEAAARSLVERNNAVVIKAQDEFAKQSQTLALRAQATQSNFELTQNDLRAVTDGTVPFLQEGYVYNEKGERVTVPMEKRRENVAAAFSAQLRAAAEARNLTPEQAEDFEIQGFATNNLENPTWTRTLASGPTAATPQNLSGESLPPGLVEGARLYMKLHDASPRLLARHIKDEATMDFYEAYRIASEYNGSDPRQALLQAVKVTQDPSGYSNPMYSVSLKAVQEAMPTTIGGLLGISQLGGQTVDNQPYVVGEIQRLTEFYLRNNMNPDQALRTATERFLQFNKPINGDYVNVGSKDLPENFPQLAVRALGAYVTNHPDEGLELDDLTIAPVEDGSGNWVIINKAFRYPVEDPATRWVNLRGLVEMEETRLNEVKQGIIGNINDGQATARQTVLDDLAASDHSGEGLTIPQVEMLERLGTTGGLVGPDGVTVEAPEATPIGDLSLSSVVSYGGGFTTVRGSDGQTYTRKGPRAWRNHNPGNIEYGPFAKAHGAVGTDGRFAVFPTYEAGRAAKSALIFDTPQYRNLTLQDAIYRYAPPSENNSASYAVRVASEAGVSLDTVMYTVPEAKRAAILDAMESVEGFKEGTVLMAEAAN